jgi:hypothetical protein
VQCPDDTSSETAISLVNTAVIYAETTMQAVRGGRAEECQTIRAAREQTLTSFAPDVIPARDRAAASLAFGAKPTAPVNSWSQAASCFARIGEDASGAQNTDHYDEVQPL